MKKITNDTLIFILAAILVILIPMSGHADQDGESAKILSEKTIAVNDIVRFGRYEQDNTAENGMEDIEWVVLETKKEEALLITKYVLDCRPFHKDAFLPSDWEKITRYRM